MKRMPLFIAVAALASAPAWANDNAAQSQGDQQSAPQAQASQSGQSRSGQQQSESKQTVKQAQEKLSAAGYEVGQPDGIMGPKTQAAIKKLQQDKQLNATGQLDQETLAALGVSEESSSTGSSSSAGSTGSSSESSPSQNATGASGGDSANGGGTSQGSSGAAR